MPLFPTSSPSHPPYSSPSLKPSPDPLSQERQKILELVQSNRAKVNALLDKMPFVIDSFGLRQVREHPSPALNADNRHRGALAPRADGA